MTPGIRLGLAALAVAALLAGGAQAGETLDAVKARGVLRVGSTGDYKPFTFRRADGSFYGADIDMAQRLAARLGVKLEIVPTVWATMTQDFTERKFDVAMGGITVLPARSAIGSFSAVTYVDGKRPVARCTDRERYTSIAAIDRPEVRVIVNPGAANEQFARANFSHAAVTVHKDNATVFDEIVAGRADVMVTDGIEADHQAVVHKELCPTDVPAPFTRLEKAYWMPKDPELLAAVDSWLADEKASGGWGRTLQAAQREP
ncbi:MAG: transporter substrate-binding domain-containing protein [Janthinobacterium lividum]